jgi:hypothetical protein
MLNAIQNRRRGREWVLKFCESEGDFTGEMGAGQFSIFGAIEEKDGHGFLQIVMD